MALKKFPNLSKIKTNWTFDGLTHSNTRTEYKWSYNYDYIELSLWNNGIAFIEGEVHSEFSIMKIDRKYKSWKSAIKQLRKLLTPKYFGSWKFSDDYYKGGHP